MKTKTLLAWIGIFILGFIPAILLFTLGPRDYSSVSHTLGQMSGLIGMTFFALSFVLSTRMKWIEYLFDGLDKVYPVHAVLGSTSLVLLLLHPLFLVLKFIPANIYLAAKYILPGGLLSVDFGIFALLGMIILLVMTLYSRMKYNNWKMSHKFLGLFFMLAVLHVFLVRADVARDYIFHGYYVYAAIVSAIGLGGFFYSLARTKLIGKKYTVKKINKVNGCFEVILEPEGEGIKFRAGQFIFVKFMNKKMGQEDHPFSIASATDDTNIRIIVKGLGDFTSQINELHEKDVAFVEGPYGMFHEDGFGNEIWIAGGIGITPFLGLAKDFEKSKKGHIELFYAVKNKDEFIRIDEFLELAKSNKNFKITPWASEELGYLSVNEISKKSSLQGKEFYLCGPESLKSAIKTALVEKNISAEKMHDERFSFK
jgi:predicted ferric reductase